MIQYNLSSAPTSAISECCVVGVFSSTPLADVLVKAGPAFQETIISTLFKKLKQPGDIAWNTEINGTSLLLIQLDEPPQYTPSRLSKHLDSAVNYLIKQRIQSATLCIPQLASLNPDCQIQHMLLRVEEQCYQLLEFKTQNRSPYSLKRIDFDLPNAHVEAVESAVAIAKSIHIARNLANLPGNIATPTYLANQAEQVAKQHKKIKTTLHDHRKLKKLGMNAFLAVAQGSHEPPQLIEIRYQGTSSDQPPVVLIGKGITFDSGGISIKPADGMQEMKYDMAGAASVLATLNACASLNLPLNVVGLLACAENMPGGSATKPGDIVTSMSGQTIEIVNTDAEGRLVLCDTMTYAERFNPRFVIDIATLTGAVVVALGSIHSGMMTQDDALADLLLSAGQQSGDTVWRLPLEEAYQNLLDSPLADMVNANFGRSAGSVVAGCFLSRYAKNFRWAHLDIAGTGWNSGKNNHATGRPVALLVQFLRALVQHEG